MIDIGLIRTSECDVTVYATSSLASHADNPRGTTTIRFQQRKSVVPQKPAIASGRLLQESDQQRIHVTRTQILLVANLCVQAVLI